MIKKLLILSLICISTLTYANYSYFWAETYESIVDPDGSTFISTKIKSSEGTAYDFSVNGETIARNMEVVGETVTDFPLIVSKRFTEGKDNILVCALKRDSTVEFKQEICLKIKLLR